MRKLTILLLTLFMAFLPEMVYAQGSQVPAEATELSQQGVSLKQVFTSSPGGIDTMVGDLLRDPQHAKTINNLQMTKPGIWTSRGIGWSAFGAATNDAIYGMGDGYDPNGAEVLTAMVNSQWRAIDSAGVHTLLLAGLATNPSSEACIRSMNGTVILTNGAQNPKQWTNGVSVGALAGWPPTLAGATFNTPLYCECFANRMAFAGFAAQPYTVIFSAYGNPAAYTISAPAVDTDAGAITVPAQLGKITGLYCMRIGTSASQVVLIVGCAHGIAMITGTGAFSFAQQEITRQFGVISDFTWVQLQNNVYFLATDGIRALASNSGLGGISTLPASYRVTNLFDRIRTSHQGLSFAVDNPDTREVQFWFPIDSNISCKNAVVMNYSNGDDPSKVFFSTKSTTAGNGFLCGCQAYNKILFGSDGVFAGPSFLQQYSGDSYNGTAIVWDWVGPLVGANNLAQNASAKKFLIACDGPTQKFTASAYTLNQNSDGTTRWTLQGSRNLSVTAQSYTDLSTWASGSTTTYPKFIDFAPLGSGRFWTVALHGGADTTEHISFAGVLNILTVGGLKQ